MDTGLKTISASNSWGETIAGTGPFVFLGLVLLVLQTPPVPEFRTWEVILFLGLLLLPPIGICIGWIKGSRAGLIHM